MPTTAARPDADGDAPERPGRSLWTYLGVGVVLAVILMWGWIFSGAPKKVNPDRLDDRVWAERAEETCRATMEEIDARSSTSSDQSRDERGDAIDTSSDDLEAMLARLADPLPDSEADRDVVGPWLDDWASLIEDRRAYADAVREDPDARFLTSEKFNDGLDDVIGTFAEVNDMPSCAPAGDVG